MCMSLRAYVNNELLRREVQVVSQVVRAIMDRSVISSEFAKIVRLSRIIKRQVVNNFAVQLLLILRVTHCSLTQLRRTMLSSDDTESKKV